ncbi:MAG: hypothetical protein QOJ23_3570 [Actinomycetota bacterium]|jgi:hypothetical protein|nr:hypothetical protein [Actinomycetota bacterium]
MIGPDDSVLLIVEDVFQYQAKQLRDRTREGILPVEDEPTAQDACSEPSVPTTMHVTHTDLLLAPDGRTRRVRWGRAAWTARRKVRWPGG